LASGAIDGNWIQLPKQFAEIAAIASYSFTVSALLLLIMKYIPGLHLRVTDEIEMIGYDVDQFDEELIGEWNMYEMHGDGTTSQITHGVPLSSPPSAEVEKVKVAANKI
jgi:ammonium transporter, Amt family